MWGALLGAGLGMLGGGLMNQLQSNTWQSDQKWLLSNSNQYKVRDLRKAGLNPVLAVQGGGVTPTAPTQSGNLDLAGSAAKGMQMSQAKSQTDLIDAQAASAKAIAEREKMLTEREEMVQKTLTDPKFKNTAANWIERQLFGDSSTGVVRSLISGFGDAAGLSVQEGSGSVSSAKDVERKKDDDESILDYLKNSTFGGSSSAEDIGIRDPFVEAIRFQKKKEEKKKKEQKRDEIFKSYMEGKKKYGYY